MLFPKLSKITTTDVVFVNQEDTLLFALEKMVDSNHRRIIVQNGKKFAQITSHDIIHLKAKGISFDTKLHEVHLEPIPSIYKNANILDTLDFVKNNFEIICVLNDEGTLFGIATASDILASIDPHIILENTKIGDIFQSTKSFITTNKDKSLELVIGELVESTRDCILVVDDNQNVEGIITSKDINQAIFKHQDFNISVKDFMTKSVKTLPDSCAVNEAIAFIQKQEFHRVVVVEENTQKLVGLITQQDLISQSYVTWSKIVKEHFSEMEEIVNIFKNRNQKLTMLASTDPLTGIYNRRMFLDLFEQNLALQIRHHHQSSLVILDVDNFKNVNDTYGHDVGDEVLVSIVNVLKDLLRTSDILARWGGEEFVVLLKHVNPVDAFKVSEKLRKNIELLEFKAMKENITCSFGLTEILLTDSLESATKRADNALYEAKRTGKNKTVQV
ncbi:MAG TPA: diguanylate cyclase [Arcobacter sp.]|nr:diguanylate cyclase [Arcobacter sp.]